MGKSKCTELIVRDESMPTIQQLEEKRRSHQEERQRPQCHAWQTWWPVVVVVAMCVLCVVALISDEHRVPREKPLSAPTGSSSAPTPIALDEQSSLDSDDPSPILEQSALRHLIRYGGYADIKENGHREFENRFTGEVISTIGQLRRCQAMLDASGDPFDPMPSDPELREIMHRVMQNLLDCVERGPTTRQDTTSERREPCPAGK